MFLFLTPLASCECPQYRGPASTCILHRDSIYSENWTTCDQLSTCDACTNVDVHVLYMLSMWPVDVQLHQHQCPAGSWWQ